MLEVNVDFWGEAARIIPVTAEGSSTNPAVLAAQRCMGKILAVLTLIMLRLMAEGVRWAA